MATKVKIIGSGVSGLSLAYFLNQNKIPVEVFDAATGPGGMIQSDHIVGFGLRETAANAFLSSDLLEKMCDDLKLPLLRTKKNARRRYIFFKGRPRRWPLSILESVGFLFRFFIFLVFTKDRSPKEMESVSEWGIKHFGTPFVRKVISPGLLGIYATDASLLSARLVLGRFWKLPLLPRLSPYSRATTPKKFKGSVSFADGMSQWTRTLRDQLERSGVKFHWQQKISTHDLQTLQNDAVVVIATSLPEAAKLLVGIDAELAMQMGQLPMNVVTTGTVFFERNSRMPRGFGALIAKEERRQSLGVLFNHHIFPGRTENPQLDSETWILRGDLSEASFISTVLEDRKALFRSSQFPRKYVHKAWNPAFPVYSLALEQFIAQHSRFPEVQPKLFLSGNYLGRLGLAQLLEYNFELATLLHKEVLHT